MEYPIGTMVCVEAPGSRGTEGQPRIIPAVVTWQWPDGSLELFCFHFEGSFHQRSVPAALVRPVPPLKPNGQAAALKFDMVADDAG